MAKFLAIVIFGVLAVAQAQRGGARVQSLDDDRRATTTPVPILKQINQVNEDGSYTYGYESADGSYKIETKSKTGEVRGKYGYYDDGGVLREIEYGASRQGFNPQGTDVKLPESAPAMAYDPVDDSGFYDPEKYETPFAYDPQSYFQQQQQQQPIRRPAAAGRRPGARRAKQQRQQQQQFSTQFSAIPQSAPPQQAPPAYQQPQVVNHQPQYYQATPAPAPVNHQQYYQPQAPQVPHFNPAQLFEGHPARNFDYKTGSYSVQYGHQG